jgi:hypothetical protein
MKCRVLAGGRKDSCQSFSIKSCGIHLIEFSANLLSPFVFINSRFSQKSLRCNVFFFGQVIIFFLGCYELFSLNFILLKPAAH